MTTTNLAIAAAFEEYATLLELKGENPFKARAYSMAARTIRSLEEECSKLMAEGRLVGIKGIGDSLRNHITELVTTGKLPGLEEVKKALPAGLVEMVQVQGLGPKKVKALFDTLGVKSLVELEKACKEGRVAKLKGFGEKTQQKILEGIAKLSKTQGRFLIPDAVERAEKMMADLRKLPQVKRAEVAGSTRRGRESVKDIDILVASTDAAPIMEHVAKLAPTILARGPTKTSMQYDDGLQVNVRVVKPEAFGAAWTYFTGSKEFNIALRGLALDKGYSLNEYAFTPLDGGAPIPCPKEEDVFSALGLEWIPPEMRENAGEIKLAAEKKLPKLVERDDLKGVFHVHTTESDGADSLDDMVKAAIALGFEFVGISDHSKAAFYANGLDEERIARQAEAIEKLRHKHGKKIRIFHGVEADILPEGGVNLDMKTLEKLDFVIASLHSQFNQPPEKMTKRVLSALEHPCVTIFGHPTARQILGRDGATFDWEAVFEVAKKNEVAVEVNGQPARLDADWVHVRRAAKLGVKLMINPDAHATDEYGYTWNALREARRGWATPADVVNTMSAKALARDFLRLD